MTIINFKEWLAAKPEERKDILEKGKIKKPKVAWYGKKTSTILLESHPEYKNHWFSGSCKPCEVIDKTIANEKYNEEFYKTYKPTVMRWTVDPQTGSSIWTPLDEDGNPKGYCKI